MPLSRPNISDIRVITSGGDYMYRTLIVDYNTLTDDEKLALLIVDEICQFTLTGSLRLSYDEEQLILANRIDVLPLNKLLDLRSMIKRAA